MPLQGSVYRDPLARQALGAPRGLCGPRADLGRDLDPLAGRLAPAGVQPASPFTSTRSAVGGCRGGAACWCGPRPATSHALSRLPDPPFSRPSSAAGQPPPPPQPARKRAAAARCGTGHCAGCAARTGPASQPVRTQRAPRPAPLALQQRRYAPRRTSCRCVDCCAQRAADARAACRGPRAGALSSNRSL
jgi:hypothetical protein